jgi:hypothetical protein
MLARVLSRDGFARGGTVGNAATAPARTGGKGRVTGGAEGTVRIVARQGTGAGPSPRG